MKILIAEDERITRLKLQRQLERWNHEVISTEDGQQAWEHFQRERFDIVVTDWDMPHMDGHQLVQHIRSGSQTHYSYLIMLTGRSETEDLVTGMEAGADDFLCKPFDKNELRVRLRAGERIIHLERELARQNSELSAANDKMRQDLEAAAKVQRELLPKDSPDTPLAAFAWFYEPCDQIGGDTLNMFLLGQRHVAMYLLDVTGHGVPASLLSVSLSQAITARDSGSSVLLTRDPLSGGIRVHDPAEVAGILNRRFPFERQDYHYFTMAYGVLDTQTRTLRFVLAGHPGPILVRPGHAPRVLEGAGLPVGIMADAVFDEYEVVLEAGDRVLFYSDGITEAWNTGNEMLGEEGFCDLIARTTTRDLQGSVDTLVQALRSWCGGRPFDDDVSLLAMDVTG